MFSSYQWIDRLWHEYSPVLLRSNLSWCEQLRAAQFINGMQYFRLQMVIFLQMSSNALEIKISVIFVNNKRRGGGVFLSVTNTCLKTLSTLRWSSLDWSRNAQMSRHANRRARISYFKVRHALGDILRGYWSRDMWHWQFSSCDMPVVAGQAFLGFRSAG